MSNESAPRVQLVTSMGDITVELNPAKAPISTENFLKYVEQGHYAGTVFHRVIDGFMIQGGGFTKELVEKPTGPPIKNEAQNGLKNDRGTIAMARTQNPDSATAQFYINVVDNAGLNYPQPDGAGYAVFGKVVEGMDVVDKIRAVQTHTATATVEGQKVEMPNVPAEPVVIKEARKVQ